MTADWLKRFRDAHAHAKSARKRLEKVIVHEIGDARADDALIELRKALAYLNEVADEAA